ncbi:MAG: hypothetical protein HQ546_01700 [Planctomycetes bacterium]|nr:hypothetical protein [Planctomycetota bacterium]
MSKAIVRLTGGDPYLVFWFGRAHCVPDQGTGLLPDPLPCIAWGPSPAKTEWPGDRGPYRLIADLERSQDIGDLDHVSANMPMLERLIARLEARAEALSRLADRARAVHARHEPSAGQRRGG